MLVGLHAWPITDFASLNEVLQRPDLAELNPLKYYAIVKNESTGNGGEQPDQLISGRLPIDAMILDSLKQAVGDLGDYAGNATPPDSDLATVKVVQPPTSLKTGLFSAGSTTTAYLKVNLRSKPNASGSAAERVSPQEIERQAMNCLSLVKSPAVLKSALDAAPPAETLDMQPEDAVAWLDQRLRAAFPGDGEILELKLEGGNAKEDSALLQSIIDAFVAAMKKPPESPTADRTEPGNLDSDEKARAAARAAHSTFLYDGKTFEQWRDLWKLELNPKRRVEAIKALTSFSRAGRGREAADAVFEVASQYDFGNYASSNDDDQVKLTVIKLCTDSYGNQLATTDWIPALEKVLKQDPKQNKTLAVWLLQQMQDTSDEAKAALQTLAANDDPEIRAAAEEARTWPETLLAELMKADANGDQQLDEQEAAATKRLYKGQLMSLDKNQDQQLSEDELQSAIPQYLNRRTGMGGGGGGMSGGAGGGFF